MANTNKGSKLYICVTPKPSNLTQSEFEGLTWVPVSNVGMIGETGTNTNLVNYDELETAVTQKSKGISNAGDPTFEMARNDTDAGQIALRAAADTNFQYAIKIEKNDKPASNYTNTILYNRGVIVGPVDQNGRNEDFDLLVFTFGGNQKQITVPPEADVVPTVVTLPAISGLVEVGETLTAYEGTWLNNPTSYTYQWQHDAAGNGTYADVAAAGTSKTYVPVVGDVGDNIRVVVTAVNGAGNSTAANSAGSILAA